MRTDQTGEVWREVRRKPPEGTCDQLTPEPAFRLQNASDSRSATTVDVPLDTLTSGTYAINLYKSGHDPATHTTCGNIEP